jgi:hypothetical protein
MEHLDGNAIGGHLYEIFGAEMTAAVGVCGSCGARSHMAELEVYLRGPGTVGRCSRCKAVLVVLVKVREFSCVDLSGLASLTPA